MKTHVRFKEQLKEKYFLLSIVIFVTSRILRFIQHHKPASLPDTPMYMPPLGNRFGLVSLTGHHPRPFNVTLLFALLKNPHLIVAFQATFSAAAWLFIIYLVGKRLDLYPAARIIALILAVILGATGNLNSWDLLLQSDSIALSSSIFLVGGLISSLKGINASRYEFAGILLVGISACLIRPFCMPALMLYILSELFNERRSAVLRKQESTKKSSPKRIPKQKNRQKAAKKKQSYFSTNLLKGAAGVASVVFIVVSQNNMDLAWGTDLAQTSGVHGRTMQQMGVIENNPFGARSIAKFKSSDGFVCFQKMDNSHTTWWGEYVHSCTSEARSFSAKLQSVLLLDALKSPWIFIKSYTKTVMSEFAPTGSNLYPEMLGRLFFGPAAASSVIYGSNGLYDSSPTVVWIFGLLILVGGLSLLRSKTRKLFDPFIWKILMSALLMVGSLYLSALFSPSDTTRVSSAPMTIYLVLVLVAFISFVSRLEVGYFSRLSLNKLSGSQKR